MKTQIEGQESNVDVVAMLRDLRDVLNKHLGETTPPAHIQAAMPALSITTLGLRLKLNTIIEHVAAEYDLDPALIKRTRVKRRSERIAWPRQVAAFFCRVFTQASLNEIGAEFNDYDHGSVLHAIRSVHSRIETEPFQKDFLTRIARDLRTILAISNSPDPVASMNLATDLKRHSVKLVGPRRPMLQLSEN